MTYLAKLRRLTDFEKTLGRLYMTVLDFSLLQSVTRGCLFAMVVSLPQDVNLVISRALPVQDILNLQAVRKLLHCMAPLPYGKSTDLQGTIQIAGIT
jgi:hypothetical protein